MTELGVQALIIDTIHVFVELVAIRLNIPYIHIWNILHIDRSGMTSPCFVSLPYEDSPDARDKYAAGVVEFGRFFSAVTDVAREYAAKHSLGIDWSKPGATDRCPRYSDSVFFHHSSQFTSNTRPLGF